MVMVKRTTEPPFEAPPGTHWYDPDQREQPEQEQPKANGKDHAALLLHYRYRPFPQIPLRKWLHAGHFIRGHVTMTVAPGGWGKSSLDLINAIEMVTCRGLIGPDPSYGQPLRVGYWNGEDPPEEIERRIAAICLHYDIDAQTLEENLLLGSKVTRGLRIATLNTAQILKINQPMLDEVIAIVAAEKLDVLVFDPLIAFHSVPESRNELMEETISTTFGRIAFEYNCCVELAQHTRKSPGAAAGELSVEDSRGGGSITNAARSVRVLNRMTAAEAKLPKIAGEDRKQYLRVERGKSNMMPAAKATWVRLVSVTLPNGPDGGPGDNVQALVSFAYPEVFAGVTSADVDWIREQVRQGFYFKTASGGERWVGVLLAQRFNLNISDDGDRTKINGILKKWFENKVLDTFPKTDPVSRHKRDFVVPGMMDAADEPASSSE